MEHFIRPVIHADKVVQCTASNHNQPLSRDREGVHSSQDREPRLQHAKASFNYHSQRGMPIIEQLLWGTRLPVCISKLLGTVVCGLVWGEECTAYYVPRVNEVVQSSYVHHHEYFFHSFQSNLLSFQPQMFIIISINDHNIIQIDNIKIPCNL